MSQPLYVTFYRVPQLFAAEALERCHVLLILGLDQALLNHSNECGEGVGFVHELMPCVGDADVAIPFGALFWFFPVFVAIVKI